MINDYTPPRDLSYGFTPADLIIQPLTSDQAPDLDVFRLLWELIDDGDEPSSGAMTAMHRTLDMALALYERMVTDPTYDGLSRTDLFGAAIHTAMIWECG